MILGNLDSKEDPGSLASSNFSNFLNDDMKGKEKKTQFSLFFYIGFYQRETFDNKKQPDSELVANFGISINSSNMSFNGGADKNRERPPTKNFYRKNDNYDLQTINENHGGFSFDNANVFKNERMSVTQLLDN